MFAKQIRIPAIDVTVWLTVVLMLALLPLLYTELTGDFPGRVLFYGQDEDSPLTGWALDAHNNLAAMLAHLQAIFTGVDPTVKTYRV